MKQVLQSLSSGIVQVEDVPMPAVGTKQLRISTRNSLVSSGTERMLVDFGRAGWVKKARQQPDKVRQVMEKVKTDGLATTVDAVRSKLEMPLAPGYCNVGIVEEIGPGVNSGMSVGDRVVSNGPHAEVVCVPQNLCARIPDSVSDEEAAFTIIGAIGLQGVRLAQPTLGECFVVTGLGLIGLMTVQVLKAHGCRVMGIDVDESKLQLAREFGAEAVNASNDDVIAAAERFSRGRGVDGVLLTLASKNSEPVSQAAQMCRKRGRIVLVGVTGLELSRADFYEKELTFQVSCSYGPGRYDTAYEEKGEDYPLGFVRWTEQRNFEAVLDMMASGIIDVTPLISHRYAIEKASDAYELLVSGEPSLGILLEYPSLNSDEDWQRSVVLNPDKVNVKAAKTPRISFVGAGNYAGRVLIPAFVNTGVQFSTVVTQSGVSGVHYGKKYGFSKTTTDVNEIFSGDDDAVVIATQHNTHADLIIRALETKKHVFVEKPLALTKDDVDQIEAALTSAPEQLLMIGFNRRFAPHIQKMKELLGSVRDPKAFIMTVNAGAIPSDHWTQDWAIGGGRIIGEACHFIDLLRHLAGCPIVGWDVASMAGVAGITNGDDRATITLTFADGSIGTVHYFSNGHKTYPKERLEVFCAGRILQLDNFRKLRGFGWPGFRRMNLWRQDKGQRACAYAFANAIRNGGTAPIPHDEIIEVSRLVVEVGEAARQ